MSRIETEEKEKRRQEYEARRMERDLESKQTEDKQSMNLGQPDSDMIPNKIWIKNIDALAQNPNVIAENIQKQNIIKKTRNPHPVSNRGRGGYFKWDFDQPRHVNLEENKEELSYVRGFLISYLIFRCFLIDWFIKIYRLWILLFNKI